MLLLAPCGRCAAKRNRIKGTFEAVWEGGVDTPHNGLQGEAQPIRGYFFQGKVENSLVEVYPKSSIKPPGGLSISNPIEGELKRDGGAYLIHIAKMMVLVLHKEISYKVEKLKLKKLEIHTVKDQKQI